jgi:RHS repeat-associated protein
MPSIRTSLSLAALLASTFLQAVEPLPYEANFERSGGFELGGLDGQRGWSVEEGSAVITDGEGREGSRALRLEPSDPVGSVGLTVATGERGNILYSDLYLRPGATNPEAGAVVGAEGSFTGFFRVEAGGEFYIFNGNGQGGGDWLATGAKFATQEDGSVQDWIRLSFRQDFDQKVWDLFINGKIFRTNLGFWKDAEVAPQEARFTLTGHTAVPLWVDDLKIDSDSVAFADADHDGLPDDWEVAQGLDATVANRDEDADGDGLTNAEELVVGTSARIADTDEDGLSDGSEIASQGNPNRKDRWPRLGIEGPANWESVRHRLVLSVPMVVRGEPSESEVSAVLDALDRQAAIRDGSIGELENFVQSAQGSSLALWIEAHDYNADSQRYKELVYTHNGSSWVLNTTVYFIWEGGSIIQKRIGGTSAYSCTNYFDEGEMRCLNNAAPTKYYYTRDHLGSVYEMTDTSAAVQAAYSYVAYGERTKRWGTGETEIAYTGHWDFKPASFAKQAASDLSLTWFRTYDPERGVWLSRDPLEEVGGLNTHQYVECNPINLTDQLGLFPNAPNNVNPLRPPYDPRRPPLQGAARECIYKRRLIGQRGNVCIYGYAILTHDHSKCRDCEPIIKNLVRLPLTRWPSHHYNVRAGWCVEEISEGDRPIFL